MNRITLTLVLLLAATLGSACASESSTHVKDTITVTGLGDVSAEPDQATIALTISAVNLNVNTAKAEADEKYRAVIKAAKKQGIDKTDIKLSSINLHPEYQWKNNTQNLIGTRVSRSLSVTINDMDKIAPLLQDLVDSNVSTIDSVQTGFQDRQALERKALVAAIEDAKDKAQFLAKQFDKSLGAAYTISSHAQSQPTYRPFNENMVRQAKTMASELPEEHFGTQKVKATVNVVFHAR